MHSLQIPEKWETKRPEELSPLDFIRLTADLFGRVDERFEGQGQGVDSVVTTSAHESSVAGTRNSEDSEPLVQDEASMYRSEKVWRKSLGLYDEE